MSQAQNQVQWLKSVSTPVDSFIASYLPPNEVQNLSVTEHRIDYIRHRRKKNEHGESSPRNSPRSDPISAQSSQQTSTVMQGFPKSVSATQQASPSCSMQLYYGPTSHFSLMQHVYRDLMSHPTAQPESSEGVVEASAGLDLFSFRRIFFGTPDSHENNRPNGLGDVPVMFLPYDLAKLFMSRYLSSLYHMLPHRPTIWYEQCLDQLYHSSPTNTLDTLTQSIILLALACMSLGTDHYSWGDILFERVKASMTAFDDVVNLQTIQSPLFCVSTRLLTYQRSYGNYQNEQGRPNAAFLHLGTATRKALAAGMHKDVPDNIDQSPANLEERRVTFWSLYAYETWFCFHAGRPSSLSLKDVAIDVAHNPFIRLLAGLCKTITRSSDEIYGQRHESLLHMWKVARSIADDLRGHEAHMKQALGIGLDSGIQTGSLGVQQTIFTTLYYHTMLLTFRPFLIFRGHWQRDLKMSLNRSKDNTGNRPTETPSWLNEACNHATTAAQKTLYHLCQASRLNDLVLQLRYHGYFMGSSTFTLIYELIHNPNVASCYLPWIYAAMQNLSTMRAGDPITSTISALQTVLCKINPSYGWSSYPAIMGEPIGQPEMTTTTPHGLSHQRTDRSIVNDAAISQGLSFGYRPDMPVSPWNLPQLEIPETGASGGSGEELLDFTQADMGWDFDFSTMDLEAFFSVYQSNDALTY
ncbi:uncharacterized protein N7511_003462 [Penicillium nucicola]|uniref:uncharacterized protein n=1 Tax=Penicillium nucicola TaxID=1850975 RepID=UPI0025456440|nr:uncharacterized protein N7511_003462 [Penicillium nucicola]KAJ5771411.1 hypothetical protein N7511_003462 [Penicillium nucicola]